MTILRKRILLYYLCNVSTTNFVYKKKITNSETLKVRFVLFSYIEERICCQHLPSTTCMLQKNLKSFVFETSHIIPSIKSVLKNISLLKLAPKPRFPYMKKV